MASVFLTDVDDYIGSSQACVNPLFTTTGGGNDDDDGAITAKKDKGAGVEAAVRLDLDDAAGNASSALKSTTQSVIPSTSTSTSTTPQRPRSSRPRRRLPRKRITVQSSTTNGDGPPPSPSDGGKKKETRATVSVADCLACSGCVTSAEAVLVDRHSIPTLRANCRPPLRDGRRRLLRDRGRDGPTQDVGECQEGADGDGRLIAFTISPAVVADLTRLLYLEGEDSSSTAGAGGVADTSADEAAPSNDDSRGGHAPRLDVAADATTVIRRLATFLHTELGADIVIDGCAMADVSLVESAEEFVHRYRRHHVQCAAPSGDVNIVDEGDCAVPLPLRLPGDVDPPTPSVAVSATETRKIVHQSPPSSSSSSPSEAVTVKHEAGRPVTPTPTRDDGEGGSSSTQLPVLTSSCPGFVCYVEKTAPHCVPHLSSAKSPMAISGYLVKHRMSDLVPCLSPPEPGGWDGRRTRGCYHVAIMPCHDKKLEASRKDLAWMQILDDEPIPDVDLVITTTELVELLSEAATASAEVKEKAGGGTISEGGEDEGGGGGAVSMVDYFESVPPAPMGRRPPPPSDEGVTIHGVVEEEECGEEKKSTEEGGRPSDDRVASSSTSASHPSGGGGGGVYKGGVSMLLKVDHRRRNEVHGESSSSPTTVLRWASPTATSSSGGSGSYADFVFRRAALDLFGFQIPPHEALPWRNASGPGGSRLNDNAGGLGGGEGVAGRRRGVIRRRRRATTDGDSGTGRNGTSDFYEVTLYRHRDGTYSMDPAAPKGGVNSAAVPVLRFAVAYGFRNIQGLVRRMKSSDGKRGAAVGGGSTEGSCDYHYVEAMACPSGCVNGGGQVRARSLVDEGSMETKTMKKERPAEMRQRAGRTNSVLDGRSVQAPDVNGEDCPSLVRTVYRRCGDDGSGKDTTEGESSSSQGDGRPPADDDTSWGPFGGEAQRTLHTRFHVVPRLELSTGAVAGVALGDTKW